MKSKNPIANRNLSIAFTAWAEINVSYLDGMSIFLETFKNNTSDEIRNICQWFA